MAETQYRRLTWPRRRTGTASIVTYSRSSLWLGEDHLLVIVSNGYAETYKRFYFQDIQALTIHLTRRRLIWNLVLGVPTAICLVVWAADLLSRRGEGLTGVIFGGVVTLLLGVPLLLNNLFGPTCACTLRTAVQTEDLPSLCRLRKTRRILNRLRPLIAQAQGQLAPEEIPARLEAWTAAAAATAPLGPTSADGGQAGVSPFSGAAMSPLPVTPDSSESSLHADIAAPEDGRTPAEQPQSAPSDAKLRYVVDDPNAPPKILS